MSLWRDDSVLPTARRLIFLRGRDVAVQQRRRQIADRHVVEAVTTVIGRQERGGVDVESQQVSDDVLILGPISAAERLGAARIRFGADAASSEASSHVSSTRRSSWESCGMLDGGMVPVCTLRTTFSQTSASAPGFATSIRSSLRSAVLSLSL